MKYFLQICALCLMTACGSVKPKGNFEITKVPPTPDYSKLETWAAHPDKKDPADMVPSGLQDEQASTEVDVLFFYPTTYTGGKKSEREWNADINDAALNKKTDNGSIQFQASIFNSTGRVYAPRYRQAHLHVFYTEKDSVNARKALEIAYMDIESAFNEYLKNWNKGRRFILAGHSQGALHAMSLLKKRIEGTPLEKQLIAAYIIGWPVKKDYFEQLQPCKTPEQTDCFCTWRTWEKQYGRRNAFEKNIVCTNPLIWTIEPGQYASATLNKGGVVTPFEVIRPQIVDAEVYNGILLSKKPKFPGSFFFRRKNYHIGDMNLYYMNIRENAKLRAK